MRPIPTDPAVLDRIAGPALEPLLSPLFGCQPWSTEIEHDPEPGVPCPVCQAVRDRSGRVIAGGVRGADPTTGRPADPYICAACQAVAPEVQRTIRHRKARVQRDPRPAPKPTRLTKREQRAVRRRPEGRAFLALVEARRKGDRDRVHHLELGFHLFKDGLIRASELEARITDDLTRQPV